MRRRTKGCSLNRKGPERGVLHSNKDTTLAVSLCLLRAGRAASEGLWTAQRKSGERKKHADAGDKHAVLWAEQQAAASEQRSLGGCCGADCRDWVKAK